MFLALASTAFAANWKIYKIDGQDYVSDENVHSFYHFERFARSDGDRIFRHPMLIMRWKTGSQTIYINNILFNLSLPIVERDGRAYISTIDLAKLVDPVLRPSYIKKPIKFDTVVIDAGHGAHDSGAKGIYGWEKNYTLDLALKLKASLEKRGFKTRMTRTTDVFLSLDQRVQFANRVDDAIFVSVHFNSSGTSAAHGIETYALAPQGTSSTNGGPAMGSFLNGNVRDAENIALATAVHAHVIDQLKTVDRGIKRARFNVLRGINKPAILFEGGFITNSTEGRKINDSDYRDQLSETIANAIVRFQNSVGAKK
ncbi:MAG: N-acetylmuramoyl-L-alanine amidase [Verrucomicrobiae bacterium]|nr:N-acetylmuramoyl-L-alanine amidase [Verrucomicrobiae bacterium]MCP5538958.1 N-acetylmuramoyl-L-alanine amidase [Akkermansiaceae bacterium]MCP5550650.1 N-acetylmuramoyl-L-alanine amidase [Akkermansiaceae bacterium]